MSHASRLEMLAAVALEYPRWAGEGAIHYAERLNVLAGYLTLEQTGQLRKGEDLKAKSEIAAHDEPELRLPYKD